MEYLVIALYVFGGSYVAAYQLEKNKSKSTSAICFLVWPLLGFVATLGILDIGTSHLQHKIKTRRSGS